ncbi:MAG: hypothetical protein HKN07_08820 [Acidimicrobiia bacterium]|nr:hypothetical protein [Acidimicrobiia bacterium]
MRRTLLLFCLVVSACVPSDDAVEGEPVGSVPTESLPGSIEAPSLPDDGVPVVVRSVRDGDSLRVEMPDGSSEEVRLLGINTPERDECLGDSSREATERLIDGENVVLSGSGDTDRDQFGRLLRYVYLADGTLVNEQLLLSGAALALSNDHEFELIFRDAEDTAFEAGLGLWGIGACGEMGSTEIRIVDIEYNPPGPDDENVNDEWVAFANTGSVTVDVSGWVVRDESTRHRFTFPGGTELSAGQEVVLRSGCGDATDSTYFWCASDPVWSNGGDTALLLDSNGNVIDRLWYQGDR